MIRPVERRGPPAYLLSMLTLRRLSGQGATACRALILAALVPVCGCTHATTAPVAVGLRDTDLVGAWTMSFQIGTRTSPLVFGSLIVSDQHDPQRPDFLAAEFSADFRPLLGRQVSCLQTPQPALVQLRDSTTIYLALTPDAADCGLVADGHFAANTFTGIWVEPSITSQPQSSGTFTMWHKS